eukprot:GHVP01064823.1.p1 GENE.GHVP01064823.1~~GHVP01064823.1.p1  ORF type:complete len:214 (+),score=40.96 GHVP01064823.1:31-642(+)
MTLEIGLFKLSEVINSEFVPVGYSLEDEELRNLSTTDLMMNGQKKSATTTQPGYMKHTATSEKKNKEAVERCQKVYVMEGDVIFQIKKPITELPKPTPKSETSKKPKVKKPMSFNSSSLNRNGKCEVDDCDSDETSSLSSSFLSDGNHVLVRREAMSDKNKTHCLTLQPPCFRGYNNRFEEKIGEKGKWRPIPEEDFNPQENE